jgi:hypothetical protein
MMHNCVTSEGESWRFGLCLNWQAGDSEDQLVVMEVVNGVSSLFEMKPMVEASALFHELRELRLGTPLPLPLSMFFLFFAFAFG